MSDFPWHIEQTGAGRQYMLGHETYIKFDDPESIIDNIVEGIKPYMWSEPAIRLTLDHELSNPAQAILSIPIKSDHQVIVRNFAKALYTSVLGYYFNADPRSSHFGVSNLILEGNTNNLLKREMERFFHQVRSRPDLAGRLLEDVVMEAEAEVPEAGTNYFTETLEKGLNIYVGYRLHIHGKDINNAQMFIPMNNGKEVIDLVYYNLEQIINQNFVSYDELGTGYLDVSEVLIYKELEMILDRARTKENTRKKILNNIQFNAVFTKNPREAIGEDAGDMLYDTLNRVQDEKLKKATDRSSDLYAAVMIKGKEMTEMNNPALIQPGVAKKPIAKKTADIEETVKSAKAEKTETPVKEGKAEEPEKVARSAKAEKVEEPIKEKIGKKAKEPTKVPEPPETKVLVPEEAKSKK